MRYLRQLALETLHMIPEDALQIFTDGSRGDGGICGSGVFIKLGSGIKIYKRNPNYCSVFRAELLAIEEALSYCVNENVNTDIWILSDSRSAIQHLSVWWKHGDKATVNIVQHLRSLCAHNKIFFQWVPSHVNVYGNEMADELAREGSLGRLTGDGCLSFSELASKVKQDINLFWRRAPLHEWYDCDRPGAALFDADSRSSQTALARLRSGHLRVQRHVSGIKVFPLCPKCNSDQAAPAHILSCIGCRKSLLYSSPATVLHCLKAHGFMDLI